MVNLSWVLEKLFQLHGTIPRLVWKDGRAFLPIHLLFEVTYRCNLRCNFCHYLDIIDGKAQPYGPSPRDLNLADITRYIDEFPAGRLISFSGGETLMRKDFPQILAHATRRHRVHIITNAALISEEIARFYVDLAPRHVWQNGLVLVEVNLQGGEDVHDRVVQRKGSWRRTMDSIRQLIRSRTEAKKRFPKLDLKLVVTKHTVGAMTEFMDVARDLGVDLVNFLAEHELIKNAEQGGRLEFLNRPQSKPEGVDTGFLRQQLIRCYELERQSGVQIRLTPNVPIDEFVRHYTDDRRLDPLEYTCEGPWSRLAIAPDARYGPMCPYVAGGDMRQETIGSLWNGEPFRAFRRATQAAGIYPGCSGCCNLKYVGSTPHGLRGVSESPLSPPSTSGDTARPELAVV